MKMQQFVLSSHSSETHTMKKSLSLLLIPLSIALGSLCINESHAESKWKALFAKNGTIWYSNTISDEGDLKVVQFKTTFSNGDERIGDTYLIECNNERAKIISGGMYDYVKKYAPDSNSLDWKTINNWKTLTLACNPRPFREW